MSNEDLVGGSSVDVEWTSVGKCFFDGIYVEVVGGREPTSDPDSIIDVELGSVAEDLVELNCSTCFVEFMSDEDLVVGIWVDAEWTSFEECSVDGICEEVVDGDRELVSDLDSIIDKELDGVAEYFVDSRCVLLGLEKELKCSICFVEITSDEDLVVEIWVDAECTSLEECSVDGVCVEVVDGDRDFDSIIDKELDNVTEYFVDSRSVWVLLGLEKELILFVEVVGIWVDGEWASIEERSVDGICVEVLDGDRELISDLDSIIEEELDVDGICVEVVDGDRELVSDLDSIIDSVAVDSRSVGVLLGLEKELTYCILLVEIRALVSDEDLFIVI